MVNKYRSSKRLNIQIEKGDVIIYDPISGMYRGGQMGFTPKFIDNSGSDFEPVPELQVHIRSVDERALKTLVEIEIVMPKEIQISSTCLQEIIYNALNSEK